MKRQNIDIESLGKNNPMVDTGKLCKSLQAIGKLKACGVSFGPNYSLGSPYATPMPKHTKKTEGSQAAFRLRNHQP